MLKKIKAWMNRRTEEMKETATMLGMDYQEKDEYGMLSLLKDFKLFKKGTSKRINHIIRSKELVEDLDISIFDYRYTISTGKSSHTYKQTVFFVQSKKLELPEFYMKPEHFFHKVAAYLGWEDIDFETHPTFSDQYHLKGEDEDSIRRMMNEEVLHFFTIEKEWSLEGIGYFLIFYRNKKLLSKEAIQDFCEKGIHITQFLKTEKE